jgi:hypothetical protein
MPKRTTNTWKHREVKLNKILGLCNYRNKTIYIDPRQNPAEFQDTLIHENLHRLFPELTERQVRKAADMLSGVLWDYGYRLVPACKTLPTEAKKRATRKVRK